jgi:hypothetical protein
MSGVDRAEALPAFLVVTVNSINFISEWQCLWFNTGTGSKDLPGRLLCNTDLTE